MRFRRLAFLQLLLFLGMHLGTVTVQAAVFFPPGQGGSPEVDKVTHPVGDPRFQPNILRTELLRGVTTGNPPGQGGAVMPFIPVPPPIILSRPQEIPDAYPGGLNDGEKFINP